jgi:hypothetical protein
MKKSTVLLNLKHTDPAAFRQVLNLQRGRIYLVEGSQRLTDIPILLTHFYQRGIRFKPLVDFPAQSWLMHFSLVMNTAGAPLGNKLPPTPAVPSTLKYTKVGKLKFTEVKPEQLPLYLDKASKYMEEFFKNYKRGTTSAD